MAQRFNLTAQLQLQANSSNVAQVVSQLKKQLAPLGNVQLNVQANTKSLAQANQQMTAFNKNAKAATGSMSDFNRSLAESARRFSVITVATGSLLSLVNAFKKSTGAAIDFEYEMVKIAQTTGQTVREVGAMSDEIRKLSTSLGVSSAELAGTARILLQAGLSADKTRKSLDILAKTTLSASFDDLQSTTEGAIALINQFRNEAARAGGDVKFLEQSLDSINAVSKAFAVESADLVDVIRKVGGVFSNAGGDVNELIALFTSVRATTRESAETIGTGLRTIFTRIQRGDTVDALKELGIELRNSQGQFVGAFEAVKRLSEGLSSLDPRDFRFAAIVEELGGYRQIGKVIPLINQFTIAQQALNVAQNANGSVSADAQVAQQALSVQIQKTKEKFDEFIASLVDSGSFRSIITGALKLADAFINIGKALEPILPLLTTLFALKAGQGLASGIGILRGFAGAPSGIRASKFASGGLVPGSGNRDTVPAMLTPGEFVIRKSSVNKLGAATLAQMNANGYAKGGEIKVNDGAIGGFFLSPEQGDPRSQKFKKQAQITNAKVLNQLGMGVSGASGRAEVLTNLSKARQEKILGVKLATTLKSNNFNKDGSIKTGSGIPKDARTKLEDPNIQAKLDKKLTRFGGVTAKVNPQTVPLSGSITGYFPGGDDIKKNSEVVGIVNEITRQSLKAAVSSASTRIDGFLNDPKINPDEKALEAAGSRVAGDANALRSVSGFIFEGIVQAITGAKLAGGTANFDFPASSIQSSRENLKKLFASGDEGISRLVKADAKRSSSKDSFDSIVSKIINDINAGRTEGLTFEKFASGGLVQKFNKGSSGTGVKPSNYPLVDDILENAKGAILPNPKNIEDIIKAGGGALDVDRTLIRTIGDKAYAQAKTEKAKEEVLKKYFVGAGRLQDIKSSPLTQFGKTLQSAIQSGQINPSNLKIITKSRRVDGVGEYLNQLFGIPLANMIFTQGGSKQPALDAFNTKGSRAQRVVKRASGGGISGSDTVPAMLTPGEFVVSKSAAQSIGYTNLNRMNKYGVTGYARGGVVGVQKFAQGGVAQQLDQFRAGTGAVSQLSIKEFVLLKQAAAKNASAFEQVAAQLSGLTDIEAVKAGLKGFIRNVDKVSDDTELVAKSLQSANKAIAQTEDANEQFARRLEQANASAARKTAGTPETRTAGSVTAQTGNFTQVQKDLVYASGMFKAMGMEGQQLKNSFARYRMFVSAGWTSQDALNQVIANTTVEVKKTQSFFQKLGASASSLGASVSSGLNKVTGGAENRQAFAQQSNQIAGSLQNFAFLGSAVAAVTSQLGLFGDATNKAIAETAGFTVGLVGIIGTVVQTLTSFATSTAMSAVSEGTQTAATNLNTTAENLNTQAINKNTLQQTAGGAAGVKLANGLGIVAVVATAVVAGLKFLSSKSKAQADAIEKERKARLAAVAETGKSDFAAGELQNSIDQELAAREYSAQIFKTSTIGAALSITAGGALIGASIGSSVPVLGTAIGAVIGGIVGFTGAMLSADALVRAANEARQKEVQSILEVYEANIKLSEVSFKLNSSLGAIESAQGLQGPEKTRRRLAAQEIGAGLAIQTAQKVRPKVEADAATLGVTQSELQALTPDEIRAKGSEKGLDQTVIEGIAARAQVSFDTLKSASDLAATRVQETGKTLQDATQGLSFGDTQAALQSVALFEQAAAAARRAIEEEQAVRLSSATTEEQKNAITQQTTSRLEAFDAGIAATEKAKKAEEEAVRRAIAAQLAMAEAARKTAVFLNSLSDQEDKIQSQSNALKNFTDALAGSVVDLSNSIKPIRNIEDPSQVTDRSRFASEVRAVARASNDPEAGKFADQLVNAADIFSKANETLLGKTLDLGESLNANQVLKNIGLTAETFGGGAAGKKIFEGIAAELTKAAQENPVLTEEALKNILGPLSEQSQAAADVINKLQSIQQKELNLRQQQLQAEQAIRDRQLAATEKYNNAVISGAEVLARARGQSVAGARSQAEQQARQRTLNVGQATRGGTFLNAADPKQLASAKKSAQEREAIIRKEINGLQSKTKLEDVEIKRLAELIKIQQQLINTSDDASQALESIAGSSSEIDKLTESLDKERGAREQAFGVLKEFVVGGVESRQGLIQASRGIFSAIQTGTTQNLPEELRSQVFGLLDKLSDVQIGQTGLTGEQLSKELIIRDAQLLGIPQEVAVALATQTTTEEKILSELERQTQLMAEAARVAAEPPTTLSNGGPVYRAAGGSIFKPRGTDTVPAMLTPGEFVINAKSTRENLPLLQAINSGQQVGATGYQKGGRVIGGVRYLADGGGFGGGIASGQTKADIEAIEEQKRQQKLNKIKEDYFKKYSELLGLQNNPLAINDSFKYLTVDAFDFLPKITPDLSEALSNKPGLLNIGNAETWTNILNTTLGNYQNRIALVDKLRSSFEETVYRNMTQFMLSAASEFSTAPDLATGVDKVKTAMLAQRTNFVIASLEQLGLQKSGFVPRNFANKLDVDGFSAQAAIAINDARKAKGLKSYEQLKAEKQGSIIQGEVVDPVINSISGTLSGAVSGIGNLVQTGIDQGQSSGFFALAENAKKQQEEKIKKEKARKAEAQTRIKKREEERNTRRDARAARNQNQGLNAANSILLQQQQQQQQPQAPLTPEQQFQQQQQQQQQIIAQQQQNLFGTGGGDLNISFGGGGSGARSRTLKRFNAKLQRYRKRGRPDWEAYYDFFGYIPNNAAEGILNIPGFNFGPSAYYYYNKGGVVGGPGGVDKVPAMLTAGEFVMNKQAVQQHGVGYMQSLNRGSNVKKFNKGGLVGGVNYLQDGGTAQSGGGFSFNFSGLQSIFDTFSGNFQNGLDNIITAFSSFGGIVGNLVSALSAGMNINHQFSGDMTLAFNIQNGDALKTQIAEAITPKLAEIITRELDSRLNNFKAGGS